MFIAVIFYIVAMANAYNEIIKAETAEGIHDLNLSKTTTYQIISLVLFVLSIIGLIIIRIISQNTLKPIKQDIERSILNDQLELSGAKVNRKHNQKIDSKISDTKHTNLQSEYDTLKLKYEKLINENDKLKTDYKQLKTQNNELKLKFDKIQNKKNSTKNVDIQKNEINIKLSNSSNQSKTISIILFIVFSIAFIIGLIFTIINFKAQKEILKIIIALVLTIIALFANIIMGILLFSKKRKN